MRKFLQSCYHAFFLSFSPEFKSVSFSGGGGAGGSKSYDGEKALPSINHSILSGNSEDRRGENGRKTVRKSGTFLLPSTVPAYVLYRTQTIWKTKLSLRSIQAQWVNVQMLTYIFDCPKKGSISGNPSIFSYSI
jgi:hypothetical protein